MKLQLNPFQEISDGIWFSGIEVGGVKFCWKSNEKGTALDACDENGKPLSLTVTPSDKNANEKNGVMRFLVAQ